MDSAKGVCAPSHDTDEMLISRLVEHEGIKKSAYQDSLGYWTIGVGRLIDERKNCGLSTDEIFYLLRNDLSSIRQKLSVYPWFIRQDIVRKDSLIELAFNIGVNGLLGFKNMISALAVNNYAVAAKELLDSSWAVQVGGARASDLQYRLLNGRYR